MKSNENNNFVNAKEQERDAYATEVYIHHVYRYIVCVGCEDRRMVVFSQGGRRLIPNIVLSAPASLLHCSGHYAMVVTGDGVLFVW